MLVLTRKIGEKLVINGDTVIEIVGIRGGKIRLGVTAPREVSVMREDLWLGTQRKGPLERIKGRNDDGRN